MSQKLLNLDPFAIALQKQKERAETGRLDDHSPNRPTDQPTRRPDAWSPSPPTLDEWETNLDDQEIGRLDDQTTTKAREERFPSRRNRIKIGARLPAQKVEKYRLWCLLNKMDLQDAIEKGLDWVTGRLDDQETRRPVTLTTAYQSNDLENALTEDIISFYQRLTKNTKWKETDATAYGEVQQLAPNIIKAGIVLSLLRIPAGNRINSFRYCVPAILETAQAPGIADGDYLKYLLSKVN